MHRMAAFLQRSLRAPCLAPAVLYSQQSHQVRRAPLRTWTSVPSTHVTRRTFCRAAVTMSAAVVAKQQAADPSAVPSENPLLDSGSFPLYDQVKAEHVVPGIQQLLSELNSELDELEQNVQPTWEGLLDPYERIQDRLSKTWGTVSHLKAVKDSEPLRKAYEEVQPEQVKLGLRMSQSRPLYEAFRAIREGDLWGTLSEAQKRVVEGELRDFVLGGVALEGTAKERFNEIQQELSKLSTTFGNNVLDATKAYKRLITEKAEVDGIPPSALELGAQQARAAGHPDATAEAGPWQFTLDFPSYSPILTHGKNRQLREDFYRAYLTRASSGATDNTPIIEKTLALRQEKAKLLGYNNFAEVSMAKKMATLDKAEHLLEDLRKASFDTAKQELEDIKDFARQQGFNEEVHHWDVTFWAERLREAKYEISDEQLRPYFSLPNVLEGLFQVIERLFGITVEAVDGQAEVWNPDVHFFLLKKDGKPKAYCYLDPYSRPEEKRGGAWMDEVVAKSRVMARAHPVAHMVLNQSPPVNGKPSLMTFREVETLFHESGHALQHMLTEQSEGLVAGIRGVEWDAVELPSQFMENFCYDRKTLNSFARHYETGELLPEEIFQKLRAARTYRAASQMMRQIHFATVDLELHARYQPGGELTIFDVDRRIAERTTVMPPLPEDRFLCGFSHIFAGGYSAGYYSYKWAEVLSADAFSAFEEAGLEDEQQVKQTGARFRDTVLALGGGRAPADVFKDFRGRDPSTEPLLRHSGLLPAAA